MFHYLKYAICVPFRNNGKGNGVLNQGLHLFDKCFESFEIVVVIRGSALGIHCFVSKVDDMIFNDPRVEPLF